MVLKDKNAFLVKYKKEEKEQMPENEIDSADYNWIVETVDNYCMNKISIDEFSISAGFITINDPCPLAHVIQSQTPGYELKYSCKKLAYFLKPEFQKRLVK
jgi:hypothetical protein